MCIRPSLTVIQFIRSVKLLLYSSVCAIKHVVNNSTSVFDRQDHLLYGFRLFYSSYSPHLIEYLNVYYSVRKASDLHKKIL